VIRRGDIARADFGGITGQAPAQRRPVIVIQADTHNRSSLGTTIVVTVTSTTDRAAIPGNVFLPASVTGLPRDSVAVVTDIITIDREQIQEAIGAVPGALMSDIDQGLRRALQL
jgi:mRNA interferase MazF